MLVAGDPKSGKSWVTGLLCEQLILYGYSLCILDPEGDYASLQALPGVTVLGGADPLPRPRELVRALRHADTSIIIDFSHVSFEEKRTYIRTVLPALATLRRETGLPHRIVLDEAHYFLGEADAPRLIDLDFGGYTLTTFRASSIHRDVLKSSQAIVVTRESDPAEVRLLHALCRSCEGRRAEAEWVSLFHGLTVGEAAVLPVTEEAEGDVRRITLAPRLTPHVRHQTKYVDIPVSRLSRVRLRAQRGRHAAARADAERLRDGPRADRYATSRRVPPAIGFLPLDHGSVWRLPTGERPSEGSKTTTGKGTRPDVVLGIAQAVRSRYDFPGPFDADRAST